MPQQGKAMSLTTTHQTAQIPPPAAPKAQIGPWRFHLADYHKMAEVGIIKSSDRVELLNGVVYPMSPIGPGHASVVDRLNRLFNRAFMDDSWLVRIQNPVRLDDHSEPEPDLVVAKFRADYYATNHPGAADILLLVEVSDASLEKDLKIKHPLYAAAGLAELWVVDLAGQCLDRYRQPVGGAYQDVHILKLGDLIRLEIPNDQALQWPVDQILGLG